MDSIKKHIDDSHYILSEENETELLKTIRIPKNLYFLQDKLPKPNYEPLKIVKLDRKSFFKTIGG